MIKARLHTGFTLLELLIAMALVVVVMTAVYGTYAASADSVEQCREVIDQVQQGRALLERMSVQLRCCYVPRQISTIDNNIDHAAAYILLKKECTFEGNKRSDESEISFITTRGLLAGKEPLTGLFRAAYRYDAQRNELWYSETRWNADDPKQKNKQNWIRIAEDVAGVGYGYYDGREWRSRWNGDEGAGLPEAVQIDLEMARKSKTPMHLNTCVKLKGTSKN